MLVSKVFHNIRDIEREPRSMSLGGQKWTVILDMP